MFFLYFINQGISIKIINVINNVYEIYLEGIVDRKEWYQYMKTINSNIEALCINDMNEVLNIKAFVFDEDYLIVLNNVIINSAKGE